MPPPRGRCQIHSCWRTAAGACPHDTPALVCSQFEAPRAGPQSNAARAHAPRPAPLAAAARHACWPRARSGGVAALGARLHCARARANTTALWYYQAGRGRGLPEYRRAGPASHPPPPSTLPAHRHARLPGGFQIWHCRWRPVSGAQSTPHTRTVQQTIWGNEGAGSEAVEQTCEGHQVSESGQPAGGHLLGGDWACSVIRLLLK